jgi:hypothetical protein
MPESKITEPAIFRNRFPIAVLIQPPLDGRVIEAPD